MKNVITGFGQELGSTEAGRAFCIKALHPSDPTTDVEGVPDQTSACTTMVNFQQTFVLNTPGAAADTWDGQLYCVPDPTMPMASYTQDSTGVHSASAMQPNTTLGATLADAIRSWATSFERWRLTYYGVTVYLDAPATANQGSVVACQYPMQALISSASGTPTQAGMAVPTHLTVRFATGDTPTYETVMQMPNSYSGQFKDGIYLPLKLDSNHAAWHNQNDLVFDGTGFATVNAENLMMPLDAGATAVGGLYPGTLGMNYVTLTDLFDGGIHYMPTISNLGAICFQGISGAANVRVVVRMGYEAMAQPGTAYTSFIKVSPAFDPAAITAYFMISRQLKDAYPAEYNDLGKLWDVIKRAASMISPFLGVLPGGNIIRAVGGFVGKGIDALVARKKSAERRPAQLSATDRAAISEANARRFKARDEAESVGRRMQMYAEYDRLKSSGLIGSSRGARPLLSKAAARVLQVKRRA